MSDSATAVRDSKALHGAGLVGRGDGDAARRVGEARDLDLPHALALVSEAVWWVTMVDTTVVLYHPGAYDNMLAGLDPAARPKAEGNARGPAARAQLDGLPLRPGGLYLSPAGGRRR